MQWIKSNGDLLFLKLADELAQEFYKDLSGSSHMT